MKSFVVALVVSVFAFNPLFAADAEEKAKEDLEGKYVTVSKPTYRLWIDSRNRVKTDLVAINGVNGERAPLRFPHTLEWDRRGRAYVTDGSFVFHYRTAYGFYSCEFNITLHAKIKNDGEDLDATFETGAHIGVDPHRGCVQFGKREIREGFTKVSE